jgi:hypothetical protein
MDTVGDNLQKHEVVGLEMRDGKTARRQDGKNGTGEERNGRRTEREESEVLSKNTHDAVRQGAV